MKFRVSQWLDTSDMDVNELPVVYGIQVNKVDGRGWHHLAIAGGEDELRKIMNSTGELHVMDRGMLRIHLGL